MRIDVFGRDARIALIVASAAVTVAPELTTLTILSDCSSDDGASGRQLLAGGDLARGHATAGDYYFPEAGSRLMLVRFESRPVSGFLLHKLSVEQSGIYGLPR